MTFSFLGLVARIVTEKKLQWRLSSNGDWLVLSMDGQREGWFWSISEGSDSAERFKLNLKADNSKNIRNKKKQKKCLPCPGIEPGPQP
jgi:hypothetical protein